MKKLIPLRNIWDTKTNEIKHPEVTEVIKGEIVVIREADVFEAEDETAAILIKKGKVKLFVETKKSKKSKSSPSVFSEGKEDK